MACRVFAVVALLLSLLAVATCLTTSQLVRAISESQGEDGSFGSIHESRFAARTLNLLHAEIPNVAALCEYASKQLQGGALNAAEAQSAVSILLDAGCRHQLQTASMPQDELSSLRQQLSSERTPLIDLASSSLRGLEAHDLRQAALSDAETSGLVSRILALQDPPAPRTVATVTPMASNTTGNATSFVMFESNETLQFQITLWTVVLLLVVAACVIYMLAYMELTRDSMLYAKSKHE
eukprot:gnl/Hemi2/2641_TR937_c0_g1_i1.p1 gnl/Hemi2/2641_TR937_c0_g1~~gnl/Hemi2/2641_TR937_c0_g1_i1.p1  ORF type:complete len:238 (-),score=66.96 gnl/Hemi2/2641_TR937_c0_g1_i1:276-989(-)